jgi:HSP20 family protein
MDEYFLNEEPRATLAVKKENKQKSEPRREGQLTVDVFQTDEEIIIQSAIAGAKPEDVDISVTNDMVTIRGKRMPNEEFDVDEYFHRELYWGPFSRSIILPSEIDSDKSKASIKNGVLTIRLPRTDKVKTKRIRIEE